MKWTFLNEIDWIWYMIIFSFVYSAYGSRLSHWNKSNAYCPEDQSTTAIIKYVWIQILYEYQVSLVNINIIVCWLILFKCYFS